MWRLGFLTAIVLMAATTSAFAQRGVGEVRLQVRDESGAAVVASGVVSSESVEVRRSFETGNDGNVILAALPYGRYQIGRAHV
mgnify:CR=1 FL=1